MNPSQPTLHLQGHRLESIVSNRFAIFLFAFWCPLMFIGGPALGDHYITEFRTLSTAGQMAVIYLFLVIANAPILWGTFVRKPYNPTHRK